MRLRLLGRVTRLAAIVLPLALVGVSCSKDSTGSGIGRVSVWLTDAPGDLKAAVVTISEVYLQGSGGEELLADKPFTLDLLTLRDDYAPLALDIPVAAGNYTQLRFVIDGAYIEVEDEGDGTSIYASADYAKVPAGRQVSGTLQMPSNDSSGLIIDLAGAGLQVGTQDEILLVDFDVAASFGQAAGGSDQWEMTPVLRATDINLTGALELTISTLAGVQFPLLHGYRLTLADLAVRVVSESGGERIVPIRIVGNKNSVIMGINFIFPGRYDVELIGPAEVGVTTSPVMPLELEIVSGELTKVDVSVAKVELVVEE